MHKIARKTNSSRKAFTLIEIILAVAIMIIIIPMIYGTFYLIQVSHARVVVMNDARDFASLNAMAIDNILANTSAATASDSGVGGYAAALYVDSSSGVLFVQQGSGAAVPAFDYPQYNLADGKQKWKLDITFQVNSSSQTVDYVIEVLDNAKPTGSDPYFTLRSSVYLPNGNRNETELLVSSTGARINFTKP
ncbi:MAG: hypothetical protein JW780_07225 [Clostridiales bacterium]|nr:hypothetical protein [Clostridiales bacterium]